MEQKKISSLLSLKEQETILLQLISNNNAEALFKCLQEGYHLTACLVQMILIAGWREQLQKFLLEYDFKYASNETDKIANAIIIAVGHEEAYKVFIRKPYNAMLKHLDTDVLRLHSHPELYRELGLWKPLVMQREFKFLPCNNRKEWISYMAELEMYDELLDNVCIASLSEVISRELIVKLLVQREAWQVIADNLETLWKIAYQALLDNDHEELLYRRQRYTALIRNHRYRCFVENKDWENLCKNRVYDDNVDWEDFYRQNKEKCVLYACKGSRKDVLFRHGHWWKALWC